MTDKKVCICSDHKEVELLIQDIKLMFLTEDWDPRGKYEFYNAFNKEMCVVNVGYNTEITLKEFHRKLSNTYKRNQKYGAPLSLEYLRDEISGGSPLGPAGPGICHNCGELPGLSYYDNLRDKKGFYQGKYGIWQGDDDNI